MTPGRSAAERIASALYSALLVALQPFYLLRLWRRGAAEPLYRHAIAERFGRYQGAPSAGWLWLHAVSLGETRAAGALVAALREQRPGLRLLLTHGTATGREAGRALLAAGDAQLWLPYDAPGPVDRFFRHFRPAAGVLMETEVWPNLARAAERHGVPLLLANARLSERSLGRGRRLAALLRPAFRSLALAMAQTPEDAARLRQAGAREVAVCGNLKYDMAPDPAQLARGRAWRAQLGRRVVVAASTREGEEAPLLDAWRASAAAASGALLAIVPRHPQRFAEVARLVEASGLRLARRSAWSDEPPESARSADVWLGDSMGEMAQYYALGDLALLGGSFEPLGGQNLIEAAACGCPVVMGPHTFNFADAAERAERSGAALRVADLRDAVDAAAQLLEGDRSVRMGEAGLAFAAEHGGAARRMAERILQDLPRS